MNWNVEEISNLKMSLDDESDEYYFNTSSISLLSKVLEINDDLTFLYAIISNCVLCL